MGADFFFYPFALKIKKKLQRKMFTKMGIGKPLHLCATIAALGKHYFTFYKLWPAILVVGICAFGWHID